MQKDSRDSSGPVKYFILHDISTIYFKSFSSFMKKQKNSTESRANMQYSRYLRKKKKQL